MLQTAVRWDAGRYNQSIILRQLVTPEANTHFKPMVNIPSLLVYYMSNSTCGPGLPCVIEARSRSEKAVPSALPAMSEPPKLITINQAESIEGFSKDRNSRQQTVD